MSAVCTPYLNFQGTAREALDFYQTVFGGEIRRSTFAELGGMGVPEEEQQQIMHSQLDLDGSPFLMVSDSPSHYGHNGFEGFSVSLSGDDEATLTGWWEGLSEGATIQEPLAKAPWGDSFGMLVDRFGIPWLVNISGSSAG